MSKSNTLYLAAFLFASVSCSSEGELGHASYPDQQSAAFQQFARQCSSCHRPPMPNVHTAVEWPMVVARMQQHKKQQGLLVMREVEQKQVLAYLQTHAKSILKQEGI